MGDRAVWGLGYNERQPSVFSFSLSSPQISAPVSLNAFDRLYQDFATDGKLVYIPNVGFPNSNSYYHMNETFVVAYNLSAHSEAQPNLLCMHNWTDPGATSVICDTATSQPKPPFHCKTDGCISTSNPDTWLALDWVRKNTTVPAACNSNTSWVGHCYYTHAPTGIAVARNAQALLVAHGAENPPIIRAFDKTGGRLIGSFEVAASKLAMAPDDLSFWAMPFGPDTKIARYATPTETGSEVAPPKELAAVTGMTTACAIAIHPVTSELYVTDRKTQQFLVFPATGGAAAVGKPWGAALKLSFPYLPSLEADGGELGDMVCATVAFTDDGKEAWVTDPGNRRIIRTNVATQEILDHVSFLTVQYVAAVDWTNPTRVFSNFIEYEVDYSKPLADTGGWKLKHNWAQGLAPEYHAAIGLSHWSFAGFQSVVTVEGHTVGMVSYMPDILGGSASGFNQAVELMPNGTLRPIYDFIRHPTKDPPFGSSPDLHPDGSMRFADVRNRNFTVIWRAAFDPTAANWTTWRPIVNLSNAAPNPPRHGGGQGQTHPLMDVDLPATGPFAVGETETVGQQKLVLTLDANNNQNYSRFHLGSAHWDPDASPSGASEVAPSPWAWTAMPGGHWNVSACNISMETTDGAVFGDTCVHHPDGALDRCGAICDASGKCSGHFPCAANVAMSAAGHVVVGFNGEGWRGGQASQWLHYDGVTGLFLGQFGTVNGVHDLPHSEFDYAGGGYATPGSAGNSFGAILVSVPAADAAGGIGDAVYLYHNDESVHGGVHRWKLSGLGERGIERVKVRV